MVSSSLSEQLLLILGTDGEAVLQFVRLQVKFLLFASCRLQGSRRGYKVGATSGIRWLCSGSERDATIRAKSSVCGNAVVDLDQKTIVQRAGDQAQVGGSGEGVEGFERST